MGNISGWAEGILLTLAFVAVLGIIIANFNVLYNQDNDLGLSDDSNAEQLFIDYQDTAQAQIEGGEVEFDATQGITLKSSYGITKDVIGIIWSFVTGGFIEKLAQAWNVGESGMILAKSIRILYFLSVVFALLYALFKVVV